MTTPVNSIGMGQADYLQLFMQELTYQDPLKPMDNKEFLTQMAQFSALQQVSESNDHLNGLLQMTSANQALSLLGKHVTSNKGTGKVVNININQQGIQLEITSGSNDAERYRIGLNEITKILG